MQQDFTKVVIDYKDKAKQLFLKELEENGYKDGFDLESVEFFARPVQDVIIAGFEYQKDIVYIRKGWGFNRDYKIVFDPKKNTVERYGPQNEVRYSTDLASAIIPLEHKGNYPGSRYFKKEIQRLDASLKKNHVHLKLDEKHTLSLEMGVEVFRTNYSSICEVSSDQVYIYLSSGSFLPRSGRLSFYYNMKTGEVSKLEVHYNPPSLM